MKKKITSFLTILVVVIIGVWQWLNPSEFLETNEPEQEQQEQTTTATTIAEETVQSIDEIDLENPPRFEKISVSSLRSVDGDTFAFYTKDGAEHKLRLLMVDTPESVKKDIAVQPYGKEASEFTKKQLVNNEISLVFDKGEVVDNYGRFLAYVYVGENSLQELLLENGLGIVRYVNAGGDSFVNELLSAQQKAQEEKKGVWSKENYVAQMKNGYYRYNEVE